MIINTLKLTYLQWTCDGLSIYWINALLIQGPSRVPYHRLEVMYISNLKESMTNYKRSHLENHQSVKPQKKTAGLVLKWWEKDCIQLMSEHGIVKSIEKDNHEWNVLFKQRKKTTEQQKQKREKFKKEMDKFFWPVCPKYEKILEKSNDPKKKEDYAWLQRLKMGKPATLGPLDRVYQRRVQRRDHQQHQESGLASTPSTSSSSSVRGTLGPGCEQRFRQRIIEQHIDRDLLMTTDGCRKK